MRTLAARRRWWTCIAADVLVMAVLALGFLLTDDLARLFAQTSDLILTFFLAWLVAFEIGRAHV